MLRLWQRKESKIMSWLQTCACKGGIKVHFLINMIPFASIVIHNNLSELQFFIYNTKNIRTKLRHCNFDVMTWIFFITHYSKFRIQFWFIGNQKKRENRKSVRHAHQRMLKWDTFYVIASSWRGNSKSLKGKLT